MSKPKPLNIEMLPFAELRRYGENPRIHNPEQVAQINGSVGEFGWTTPVLIDAEGSVIGGHGRLEAAEQRGMDEVPVIRLAHLTPEQSRAYRIADNRLTELGGWDHGLLSADLDTLGQADFDLELTGFDWHALEDLMPAEGAPAAEDDQGAGRRTARPARAMPGVRARVQGVRRRGMGGVRVFEGSGGA